MFKYPLTALLGTLLGFLVLQADAQDVDGSADHSLIGRFEGATINYYDVVKFDEYRILTGPVTDQNNVKDSKTVEGTKTSIAYHMPAGTSFLEVMRNFEIRLEEAGFNILYHCNSEECGSNSFSNATETLAAPFMGVDPWNMRYLAAERVRPEGNVYATLLTSTDGSAVTKTQLIVIEEHGMRFKMVDASKMAKAIAETGSIALYGIYFDSGKADIKPDSEATLTEIAKLLQEHADLKLLVVGHTDNRGAYDYNMDLSSRRAASVVHALVEDNRIDAARLKAGGAGYLSPVASNRTEAGRAKNRRVQLVEQ
ncbi:MAG: DUF4892 domain-containing protein [Gammaproteobacteria bacterium]|nr:DUF4892 domain-containing protein [Gammaproteobacteria bacterium]